MSYSVLYFDDEVFSPGRDAQKIQELLNVPGEFECKLQLPPKTFASVPATAQLDGVLIDLDLSSAAIDGEFISYFGSTLASEIRMRNPACPIVLVTRPQAIGWKEVVLQQSIDVDSIIYKDDINREPDLQRNHIKELIDGYKALAGIQGQSWENVISLMRASPQEANLLREAGPPITRQSWNIPQVSRWIRTVVMEYPGILYDELTAATRLGVSLDSFRQPKVQDLLESTRYTGLFGTYTRRWWRDRLFHKAFEITSECNLKGSIPNNYAQAMKLKYGIDMTPAICVHDNTAVADWVCYVLEQPVKQHSSLPYYPDNRPAVMDAARVSFKAIQESNEFDERLIDADSYQIVKELWG